MPLIENEKETKKKKKKEDERKRLEFLGEQKIRSLQLHMNQLQDVLNFPLQVNSACTPIQNQHDHLTELNLPSPPVENYTALLQSGEIDLPTSPTFEMSFESSSSLQQKETDGFCSVVSSILMDNSDLQCPNCILVESKLQKG